MAGTAGGWAGITGSFAGRMGDLAVRIEGLAEIAGNLVGIAEGYMAGIMEDGFHYSEMVVVPGNSQEPSITNMA